MTMPDGQPFNIASDRSQVGVQARNAYFDTVTFPGDVQLTIGQDAPPATKYRVGVENLKSGNPRMARELIWEAMMSGHRHSEVLFHWLVAMLSGRTVRHFSSDEIDQLKQSRSRYSDDGGDAWAQGVRLIYRLLDSVLPSIAAKPRAVKPDMPVLLEQFGSLGEEQRDMVGPYLELFLTGPRQDEMWQRGLELARSRQLAGGRLGRAWMFFQPSPAQVILPPPQPERISTAHRLASRASACLFAVAAGYLSWELLWHHAFLGLLGYVAALAGGVVGAAADLEWRFLTGRRRSKDEQFHIPNRPAPRSAGNELADLADRLFNRYITRYLDKTERENWKAATTGHRKLYRDEIIGICRDNGIPVNEVAWLIRYEVRRLKQRWRDGSLYEYQQRLLPRPGTVAARRAGLIVLVLGGGWAIFALRAHPVADVAALLSGLYAWWCWLRENLERRRYAADKEEHDQRQAEIDKEFKRWSARLETRPKDADMATWLGHDRTVLLGMALDHFGLSRSRLKAHAFLEEPGVGVRRARIEDHPWRYAGYRILMFLLAEDGVRQVRASLDFTTGALTVRERTSYRYDAIVSVHVVREARRGQTFQLRLAAGDPIVIRVRDVDAGETQDQDAGPAEENQEPGEMEEATALDVASVAVLMHMLEGVAGEGRSWLHERERAGSWSIDDEAERPHMAGGA